jgi:L-alanine-DL-glutamate epimerase-like enolase superfamily enzyme
VKITAVETIPISLPVGKFQDGEDKVRGIDAPERYLTRENVKRPRDRNADGNLILSNVIVKIHTDEGVTGIGEAACDAAEPVEVVRAMIDRHMGPRLIGQDPMNWRYLIDQVSWDAVRGATRFSTSGIDLALHDLVAKALGVPVYTLLGGCRRTRVLASIEVPRNTPEKMAEHSYEYYQQGIRGIKAKIGSDPVRDAECIKAIREKLGDGISLRADANRGYTVKEAITFCNLVEQYNVNLEVLEQPVGTMDLGGTKQIKEATSIPVEVDESAFSLSQLHQIVKRDVADVINTKCAKAGGIRGVELWAAVAEAADLPIVIGTEWGAGLKVAAKLHLGAAIKNADPVVEFTEMMIHELLLKEPLKLHDGYLDVPTAPGLGMALDDEKIEAIRIDTKNTKQPR